MSNKKRGSSLRRGRDNGSTTRGSSKGRHRKKKTFGERIRSISARPVIIAVLLVVFAGFAVGPVSRNLEATSRLKKAERELEKERGITESLQEEVEEARSLDYIELEARRQRLVAPGEVLYLITDEDDESNIEYRVKSVQSMDEAWERVRLMLNCTHRRSPDAE